ncbi:uncharacterized protein [Zea mays]|uniref:uncharacterized protein isoform X3 n=1 Tax=Zea mays TaxID=4577 RepID=UPI0004DEB8B2|nr:uncharacterized protein LOC103626929 isoform X3 [Zea mays]|eukprot:XP_008645508.1 uncharacterized protein LOC103626929 isoform X3 [Zea mays]
MEQSSDGLPISQRRANSSTKHSSKSDEVAEDMLQSNIPHETVRLCQGVESEEIEGPPHKKIVQNFTESSSSKNKKHRWSSEENEALKQMVKKYGTKNWRTIACAIPGRNANSCLSRWKYLLDPAINKEPWSQQEELRLIRAQQVYGNKWCKMVKHFPGRTNDALKEHWRSPMKRKLDSYLASGLLEHVPDLQDDVSFPQTQNNQSDIPKDCKAASDRNRFSSRLSTDPKLKQELTELDENAKISEMRMAKSQQCAGTRKKLAFLSTPVELKSVVPHETTKHCQDMEPEKTEGPLCKRNSHCIKDGSSLKIPESTKGKWLAEENEILIKMVTKHGKNWQTVAFAIPGREAKQCQIRRVAYHYIKKKRWTRSLDPAIKKQDWSEQEDLKLIRAHQIYGSQWLKMVKHFPGRTNHALKEHWRNRIKGKLNFYLASGLLEQVPDLEEGGISVPESSQSEIPKDSQGSADRSGPPPVLRAQPKSKPELPENAGTSGEGTSDSIRLKGPNAHPTEVSEKVLAKSKQRARARRRLDFLSTPVELKLCTAAASCQRPPQKMDQPGPVAENISPSDACQDISQNVPPERADAITPLAASNHHSPATPVDPFSLEMHEANASDLLDMSYCDGLIIDSPRDPHDGSLM